MTRQSHLGNGKSSHSAFAAKLALKRAGLPQLRAAPLLGVTFEHLNRVLNGHRESRRLLAAIHDLCAAKERA